MIETDDEMFRVDGHWLGPPGRAFPRPIRHQAIGIGAVIFFGVFVVMFSILALPANGWTITAFACATYWLTRRFLNYLGHERTIASTIRSATNDLTSPRPAASKKKDRQPHTVSIAEQLARVHLDPTSSQYPTSSAVSPSAASPLRWRRCRREKATTR